MLRRALITILALVSAAEIRAQSLDTEMADSTPIDYVYTPLDQASSAKLGLHFFKNLDLEPELTHRTNISIAALPTYTPHRGLGIGLSGDIRYGQHRNNVPQNRVYISASASLTGCYEISIDGHHLLPSGIDRLRYDASIFSEPTRLYGLDYATSQQGSYGNYTKRGFNIEIGYSIRASEHLTLCALADYIAMRTTSPNRRAEEILQHHPRAYSGAGIGLEVEFSTHRVYEVNEQRGIRLNIKGLLRPNVLNSGNHTLWGINSSFNIYKPLWRGALLRVEIWGEHLSKHTPWMLRSALGNDFQMRGYYASRYNGNTQIGTQVELGQLFLNNLVIAGWGAVATIFSPNDKASWHKLLPNYGVGIRWHANATSALRLDLGFGKRTWGIILGVDRPF